MTGLPLRAGQEVGQPTTQAECAAWFRDLPKTATVRIAGQGSRESGVPNPGSQTNANSLVATHQLSTLGMHEIHRLEPGDLTCSVGPGLPVHALIEALEAEKLALPCETGDASGTVGGLFAADPWANFSTSRRAPRSLLLGIEAVLPEGKAFKAGASVVKSVAGFDLAKLFVGSRGTLFAATTLHLRLAAQPHTQFSFIEQGFDRDGAIARFESLRQLRGPLIELRVIQTANGECSVAGTLAGMAPDVDSACRHILPSARMSQSAEPPFAAPAPTSTGSTNLEDACVLRGHVALRRAEDWLKSLPAEATWLLGFGGGFEVRVPANCDVQTILRACPTFEASALAVRGKNSGSTSPRDFDAAHERAAALENDVREAFDPMARLR